MQNQRPEPSLDVLKRFLACKCSAKEEEDITIWYHGLGQERAKLQLSPEEQEVLKRKLWSAIRKGARGMAPSAKIQAETLGQLPRSGRYKHLLIWPGLAAACLLLFLLFPPKGYRTYPDLPERGNRTVLQDNHTVYRNTTGKTICIALPDTSLVWLRPMGTLTFTDFRQQRRREVTLNGEAYFEVTSDPEKPFLVYAGEVTTRVLGTKFNIKANLGEQTVEVEVTEGTVALSSSGGRSGGSGSGSGGSGLEAPAPEAGGRERQEQQMRPKRVRLTANQKAVYDLQEKKLVKLALPEGVSYTFDEISEKTSFEFNNTPLKTVLALLEKAYHITIELENEALNHCTLTASLNEETLNTKMELICKSIGAAYTRAQNTIFISGSGCPDLADSFFEP